jgi:hypothetical protein
VGRLRRFDPDAVVAWIAARRVAPQTPKATDMHFW